MAQSLRPSILPGFGLTLGYTLTYVSLLVLVPIAALVLKTAHLHWGEFWHIVSSPRVVASYRLSFGAALVAAVINAVFGSIIAWVLVRYRFPGRNLLDALIDLPFALPTAVAGIALVTLYDHHGWIGRFLPVPVVYRPAGIVIALTFIGLPFVVRSVQPVIESISTRAGAEIEEAAVCLGASRAATLWRIVLPELWPAIAAGFTLAFARGVGEYGSVVFIAGNMPMRTEIAPLLIITRLEEYDYSCATAIAVVMLLFSFIALISVSALQRYLEGRLRHV
jgi:sulfate transport system permease protein